MSELTGSVGSREAGVVYGFDERKLSPGAFYLATYAGDNVDEGAVPLAWWVIDCLLQADDDPQE